LAERPGSVTSDDRIAVGEGPHKRGYGAGVFEVAERHGRVSAQPLPLRAFDRTVPESLVVRGFIDVKQLDQLWIRHIASRREFLVDPLLDQHVVGAYILADVTAEDPRLHQWPQV